MSDVFTVSHSAAYSLARQVPSQSSENLFGLRPGTIRALTEVANGSEDVPVRCDEWQHSPHVDLTHTETSLHIDDAGPFIGDLPWPAVVGASVITIVATTLEASGETGPSNALPDDWVISKRQLDKSTIEPDVALVVFAEPIDSDSSPPCPVYFTHEAMQLVVERQIQHLLYSEFSVDRADDNGELHNHRMFWNLPTHGMRTDSRAASPQQRASWTQLPSDDSRRKRIATITENIERPEGLVDGKYLLVLNPMPAQTDASPSAPILLTRIP